jgi:hypothetical protein
MIAGLPMPSARCAVTSVSSVQTACRCVGSLAFCTSAAGVAAGSDASRPLQMSLMPATPMQITSVSP